MKSDFQLEWFVQKLFNIPEEVPLDGSEKSKEVSYLRSRLFLDDAHRKKKITILRSMIPEIKVLWFDSSYQIDGKKSDHVPMNAPFKGLVDALGIKETTPPDSPQRQLKEQMAFLKMGGFGKEANFNWILGHGGEFHEVSLAGKKGLLCWNDVSTGRWTGKIFGGYVIYIEESMIPSDFSAKCIALRHRQKFKKMGIDFCWYDATDSKRSRWPGSVPKSERNRLMEAIFKQPSVSYYDEALKISGAIYHHDQRFALLALSSHKALYDEFESGMRQIRGFLFCLALVPTAVLLFFRRNRGLSLGLSWQVLGLFLFAIGIPTLATFQIGQGLVRDHRVAAERAVFQIMENASEVVMNSFFLGLRRFEKKCEEIGKSLEKSGVDLFDLDEKQKEKLPGLIQDAFAESGGTHLYVVNDFGKMICTVSVNKAREEEGKEFQHLFEILAKMKLRASGKPVQGKEDITEQAFAASIPNIQEVKGLLEIEKKAFNIQFFDKTLYIYSMVIPSADNSKNIVLIFVGAAVYYERNFLNFFINEIFRRNPDSREGMEMLAVHNDASFDSELLPNRGPAAKYNNDTFLEFRKKIINTALPTMKNGFTIRDEIIFNEKKQLFFSQKIKYFERYSLILLFDYAQIEKSIKEIMFQTYAYIGFYFFISIVLAFLLSRGLLSPVGKLREGVNLVSKAEFDTHIELPGRDEIVELSRAFNDMAKGLWEREKMTAFLSRSTVESVKELSPTRMGGERVFAGVLIANIRGFTTIVENNPPENIVLLLNEYFSRMHEIVLKNGGDIDKFLGDTIMAVFFLDKNIVSKEALAQTAIKCGIEMMQNLDEFNRRRKASVSRDSFSLSVGIGVAAGELIAGNIGSVTRKDHTILGEPVNIARVLERESMKGKHSRVIVNKNIRDLLGDKLEVEKMKPVLVKGMTKEVEMYEVVQIL